MEFPLTIFYTPEKPFCGKVDWINLRVVLIYYDTCVYHIMNSVNVQGRVCGIMIEHRRVAFTLAINLKTVSNVLRLACNFLGVIGSQLLGLRYTQFKCREIS